jgi:outer membrane lipoprotein SlyB
MNKSVLLPVVLAVGLSACASNGVQPGIVNGNNSSGGGYQNASASAPVSMGSGRVVSINETQLAGSGGGGSGMSNGTMSGGLIGGAGGAALGAVVGHGGVGGILLGGLLGAVGGAVAGNIYDGHRSGGGSGGRGIEVTVQREDGATMKVAQRDDGDIQLGDRVQIVQDGRGVAKVVRDNSRAPDNYPSQQGPDNGPPPQDMQSSNQQQRYVPRGQDSPPPQQQDNQNYSQSRNTQRPQDDPRYGNLD